MKKIVYTLLCACCGLTAGAQSGNMETWRNYTTSPAAFPLQAPVGWYGSDSALIDYAWKVKPNGDFKQQVFRTTASHTGSYAVKLMTRNMSWLSGTPMPYVAMLSNARITVDTVALPQFMDFLKLRGGTPVTQRINSVSFWLMQDSVHPDKSMLQVTALLAGQGTGGKDSVVGDTLTTLYMGATPGYNLVTLPIPYKNGTVVPDRIAVAIYSGSFYVATVPYDSAALYVDDVLLNTASGVSYSILKEPGIRCLQHRSAGYLELQTTLEKPLLLQVYDAAGRRCGSYPFTGNTRIPLPAHLPEAPLLYRISDGAGRPVQQGKFTLAD